jgi:hypothetical protein
MKTKEIEFKKGNLHLYIQYNVRMIGFLIDWEKYGNKYTFAIGLPFLVFSFEYIKKC